LKERPVKAARQVETKCLAAKGGRITGIETRPEQKARPVRRTEHYALLELN
jgi:hypothetical protein